MGADLDLLGFTGWGLNVAASGWGHQGDAFATLTSGIQTAGPSSKGGADIQLCFYHRPGHVPLHASHVIETPCNSNLPQTSNSQQILSRPSKLSTIYKETSI